MAGLPILKMLLGVPVLARERAAYDEALQRYLGGPRAVSEYCIRSLDRVMNKAVGLMQANSIFAALALFMAEQPGQRLLGSTALVVLVMAVGLLCTTLLATTSGIAAHRVNEDAIMAHGMKLIRGRTMRFTIALWLSGLGYAVILVQVLLSLVSSA